MKNFITFLICVGVPLFVFGGITFMMILLGVGQERHGETATGQISPGYFERCTFDGHVYILFKGEKRSGIVHDPDCQCQCKHKDNDYKK